MTIFNKIFKDQKLYLFSKFLIQIIKWGAPWGKIETTVIGKTQPTLGEPDWFTGVSEGDVYHILAYAALTVLCITMQPTWCMQHTNVFFYTWVRFRNWIQATFSNILTIKWIFNMFPGKFCSGSKSHAFSICWIR